MSKKLSFSRLIERRHLGIALTLKDFETWETASALSQARLSPQELASAAWAFLNSLERDTAWSVVENFFGGVGMPLPPFIDPSDEAAFWVSLASPEELHAYAVAIFQALSPAERQQFIDYAKGKAA